MVSKLRKLTKMDDVSPATLRARVWVFGLIGLLIGLVVGGLSGILQPKPPTAARNFEINIVKTPNGKVMFAPQAGDDIKWSQIDDNGNLTAMGVDFSKHQGGNPCGNQDNDASHCVVKQEALNHIFLYDCNGCDDPGIMPGGGTRAGSSGAGTSPELTPGFVFVGCSAGSTITATPAAPTTVGKLQWLNDASFTGSFTVNIASPICTGGAFQTSNTTPTRTCKLSANPGPNPQFKVTIPNCGAPKSFPIQAR